MQENRIPFNPIRMDTTTAISNEQRGNDGDYIILASSPAGSNVRIRLNDNTGPEIEMHNRYAVRAKGINRFFVTADAVAGGEIIFYQSDSIEDFELITPPQAVEEVASLGADALTQLDKIMNPYNSTSTLVESSATTLTTILSKVLTVDKIELFLDSGIYCTGGTFAYVIAELDGVEIGSASNYYSAGQGGLNTKFQNSIYSCTGKTLVIKGMNPHTGAKFSATVTEHVPKA